MAQFYPLWWAIYSSKVFKVTLLKWHLKDDRKHNFQKKEINKDVVVSVEWFHIWCHFENFVMSKNDKNRLSTILKIHLTKYKFKATQHKPLKDIGGIRYLRGLSIPCWPRFVLFVTIRHAIFCGEGISITYYNLQKI